MLPIRWVLFWTLVVLVAAVLSTAFIREWSRVVYLKETLIQKEREVRVLTEKVKRAEEKLKFYETPKGKARLAREQFNLVFPGERIYRLSLESGDALPKSGI